MVRFKNRWLLVEFIPIVADKPSYLPSEGVTTRLIWNALKDSVTANFGDVGWGAVAMSLTVKYFSPVTNICIVRVARDHFRIAWGAVTLVTTLGGREYLPAVLHVSGTIKHAQLAAIEHNRKAVAQIRAELKISALHKSTYDNFLEDSNKEIEALQE